MLQNKIYIYQSKRFNIKIQNSLIRLNNEALYGREHTTNQRQNELIELIQNLQTATARGALDALTIAKTPKARNLNSAKAIFQETKMKILMNGS